MPNNPDIRIAREVGMNILKPSQRDLEHGLELHEHSLVIESYSLGLHASVESKTINAEIEAGASDFEIQDLVEDMSMTRWVLDDVLRSEYCEARKAAGVTCSYQNAGEECNDPLRILKRLARHSFVTDAMPDFLRRVTTPEDIISAHREGKYCTCLTTNGVPLTGNQIAVEDEMRVLRVFVQLGVRMMHLTYNRRNLIGDGCGETANAGLSDFGRAVVREMNRLGVMIDGAHAGWKTTIEAAEASEKPIVISHSAAWDLGRHIRCKPDEVIRAVVDKGGTMGITNVPAFLGGRGDISSLLDHIDHVAKKFGSGAVTIGTDRAYCALQSEGEGAKINPRCKQRDRWESFWPPGDRIRAPEWLKPEQLQSMAWTNWPLFTVGLVQRGYSDEEIQAMIGGNMLRVAREVWKGSAYDTNTEKMNEL